MQTPTYADLYCAGFISKQLLPNANFVAGGLQTPNTTKFVNGDIVYSGRRRLHAGGQYTILRELEDQNRYEVFPGQQKALAEAGQPYGELAGCALSIPAARWPSRRSNSVVTRQSRRHRRTFRRETAHFVSSSAAL